MAKERDEHWNGRRHVMPKAQAPADAGYRVSLTGGQKAAVEAALQGLVDAGAAAELVEGLAAIRAAQTT